MKIWMKTHFDSFNELQNIKAKNCHYIKIYYDNIEELVKDLIKYPDGNFYVDANDTTYSIQYDKRYKCLMIRGSHYWLPADGDLFMKDYSPYRYIAQPDEETFENLLKTYGNTTK